VDDLDPGPPVLHSRYGWHTRYRKYLLLEIVAYAILLVIVMSIVSAVLYLVIDDANLAVLLVVLVTVCYVVAEFWSKGITGLGTAPGLYQEGLFHPRGFLIPYAEIQYVHVRRGPVPFLMPDRVVLTPRHELRLVDYSEWELELHILGDDGLELLTELVADVPMEEGG
jgi:hypothetical protein